MIHRIIDNITWTPGIGDPSLMGWTTVLCYVLASLASFAVYIRAGRSAFRFEIYPLFWLLMGVLMMLLAINKQLDLQSLITDIGKCIAKEQGWYQQRKSVQFGFIVSMLGVALCFLLFLLYSLRKNYRAVGVALIGLVCLLSFIVVRATSFHHVDVLISSEWLGLKVNWILELGGILCILVNACYLLKKAAGSGQASSPATISRG